MSGHPSSLFFSLFIIHDEMIQPIMHPILLWNISSNSKSPRHQISWESSIQPEITRPLNSPSYHFKCRPRTNGKSTPAGNNKITLSNTSSSISKFPLRMARYDQNGVSMYLLSAGLRPNTVDPRTISRKDIRRNRAIACVDLIFFFLHKKKEIATVRTSISIAAYISFVVHV